MDSSDATGAVGFGSVYLKLRAQEVLEAKSWLAHQGVDNRTTEESDKKNGKTVTSTKECVSTKWKHGEL